MSGESFADAKAEGMAAITGGRTALIKQPPSVGRIVHFYAPTSPGVPLDGPYAGIITGVGPDGVCALMTFGPSGSTYPHLAVNFSEAPAAGCWSWPPRIP